MTVRLVDGGWGEEFAEALRVDAGELRIICPFIKAEAVERLLCHRPSDIRVITRFDLADFAEGVSDVAALGKLLDVGASVRGVRNLHAKLYLFGRRRAMITSANLTEAALSRNHEFGIVTEQKAVVAECLHYFDRLWQRAGDDLRPSRVDAWDKTVADYWAGDGRPRGAAGLGDFGADAAVADPPPQRLPVAVADASQAFVKFLGQGKDRKPLSHPTIAEVERAGCHWAVCYPATKRPRSIEDGDVIFIGRFTRGPNDIRVFGRAIGMKHRPGRDDATPADIKRRDFKETWSRYIRVHHAEFVDGTMENGVSLNELMDTLQADSFASTQQNASRGQGNTDPRRAYLQQPGVKLSAEGLSWLSERLQAAFEAHGNVPQDSLDKLDWPDSSVSPSSSH